MEVVTSGRTGAGIPGDQSDLPDLSFERLPLLPPGVSSPPNGMFDAVQSEVDEQPLSQGDQAQSPGLLGES